MILFVATTNRDKLREIRALLADVPVTLASLADLPPVAAPEETGPTFEDNARLKALFYDRRVQDRRRVGSESVPEPAFAVDTLTVAEDSGLEVDGLGGEPGVRSARFLHPDATYPERFAEIERRLRQRPDAPRTARFVCAIAVAHQGRVIFETRGTIEGEIATTARGSAGFGYDPIFFFPPYGKTLAEVTEEEKLREAHRGVAFRRLAAWLRETKNGER